MDELIDIFRRHARPLAPIATGAIPELHRLEGARAVMFDVYGTLLLSASGEVGTAGAASGDALTEALTAAGVPLTAPVAEGAELLFNTIRARHQELRSQGIEYPEVDIREMWQRVLEELGRRDLVEEPAIDGVDPRRLAIEYEARANPCWPMPQLAACLERIAGAGMMMGIVSNAQFYTPLLFPALSGKPLGPRGFDQESCEVQGKGDRSMFSVDGSRPSRHLLAEKRTSPRNLQFSWGFDPGLLFYSFEHGHGKPGRELYRRAATALEARGVEPSEVVYVGNDLLNDVSPAAEAGFRTVLFAGDRRSLRLREGDSRVEGVLPDAVITDLGQLAECLAG